jgi:CRISPR-associated endonuclease/helicase Cas3
MVKFLGLVIIMSFSYKLKSHIKEGQNIEDGQLLVDHLQSVSKIALETTRLHGVTGDIGPIIETICLCHDFGKASKYFQQYLEGKYNGNLKDHGEISAYFAYYMLPEDWKLIGFMCVKRHHGDMEPDVILFDYNKNKLLKIATSIEENIEELNIIYNKDISEFFIKIRDEDFLKSPMRNYRKSRNKWTVKDFIWLQYLWSLLLTADKTQLIRGEAYKNRKDIFEEYVFNYKEETRNKLLRENPGIGNSLLFEMRNQIYRDVVENIEKADINSEHIFSINVPTGTGKTISAYAAAFKLMERVYKESNKKIIPTIIYALPFTSVIDQNYDVLQDILVSSNIETFESFILKHHSMTELSYRDDEAKEYKNYDARFCVENWQSTIITTTFIQLFNTIFQSGKNSIIHRFHKLAGSIIILDEIQAIDPKYYSIIEDVFDILCKEFNCYIITVTATKPLFLSGVELVGNNEKFFKGLERIQIQNYTAQPIYVEEFCTIVEDDIVGNNDKSFLIVANTVKSSLAIFNYINESKQIQAQGRNIRYLSTEIYPARRLEIIKEIKENKDEKYILVSTQLIEAGVDIDFDIVYRDFSTIDSINQTAGRANRNGIKGKGLVKLYSLMNENHNDRKFAGYIYSDTLLDITERILTDKDIIEESDIFEINELYFGEVDKRKSGDLSEDLKRAICQFKFNEIRKRFKLIDDDFDKEDIIINYNEETQKCLNIIEEGICDYQAILNAWRKLNSYKISVYKKDFSSIPCESVKGINVLDKEYYDENYGIIRTGTAVE